MNRYLEKIARSETKDHQSRVIDKLENNSIVAAHSMGSGKTLTALLAAERAQKKHPTEHVTAIVPASLVSNMKDQAVQHGVDLDMDRFEVTTYDKASNDVNRLKQKNHSLIIVDEAHKLRNKDTKRSSEIEKILKSSRKSLLLSGTPSYNKPEDIAVLVNKAAGTKVLPDNAKDFEDRFIGRRKVEPGFFAKHVLGVEPGEITYLKNQGELREALNKYIDHYDAQEHSAGDFPTAHHRTIKVTMSPEQKRMYKFLEDDMPAPIKWKIRLGLPLSKKESSNLNAFSTGVRQVSNSTKPYSKNPAAEPLSPKQLKMADSIHEKMLSDKNYRGISYSNYIESGLKPLSEELTRRGISHAVYDGSLSQREKDAVVDKYNKGEIKQLLISSSGAEGLNTKGTKLVQVMEPHFNKSKIDQVVARAVRYKSHEHLPEDERHVDVEHYHSVMEPGLVDKIVGHKTKTIDEYLHEASDTKDKLRADIMALTKQAGERMNKYLEKIAEASEYALPAIAGAGVGAGAGYTLNQALIGGAGNDFHEALSGYAKTKVLHEAAVENYFARDKMPPKVEEKLWNNMASLSEKKMAFSEAMQEANRTAEILRGQRNKYLKVGAVVGGLAGLGIGLGKQAEASDYAAPVAVGAGVGGLGSWMVHDNMLTKAVKNHRNIIAKGSTEVAKSDLALHEVLLADQYMDVLKEHPHAVGFGSSGRMPDHIKTRREQALKRIEEIENSAFVDAFEEKESRLAGKVSALKNRKGALIASGMAAGAGLGAYLHSREKRAETRDYLVPAGGAAAGAVGGAGIYLNHIKNKLIRGEGPGGLHIPDMPSHELKQAYDDALRHVDEDILHAEEEIRRHKWSRDNLNQSASDLHERYIARHEDHLETHRDARRRILEDKLDNYVKPQIARSKTTKSVERMLIPALKKGLAVGAGVGGLGAYMYNREKQASEQDTYERLLPYGYAGVAAPVGAYGAVRYIGGRIDPIQTKHDAIRSWSDHELKYLQYEADRVGNHVTQAYERLGAMREANVSDTELSQQRAKADRLYELHANKKYALDYHQKRILANEPKLKTMAEQVSKYKKLRLPAALGAATLAGGAAFGLGKLHGRYIDRELANEYQ